ncbi:MAG: DUF2797 domain-containing protein [Flavobacteriales bacterium]|nr:DUF2797 domain-containing protein [Flavobacteriales bacterium]
MLATADPSAGGEVTYALDRAGLEPLPLAEFIGGRFGLRFTGGRVCMACGKAVKKFYGQGLCYPCLRDAPEASECIVRPELCRAHLGEGRDPAWEQRNHAQEHVVYLSFTGAVKVGVTRSTQVPVRWIDQGATGAVVIARTPYRQLAGLIEVDLKRLFTDRTDWRAMLGTREAHTERLLAAREQALAALPTRLQEWALPAEPPLELRFPLHEPLGPVRSLSFEKVPGIAGRLVGIKGQYLIWDGGRVFNVRNHSGYVTEVISGPEELNETLPGTPA